MVQRGKVNKREDRGREQGLRTEYVPCHHIYNPCEADRIDVMPADKRSREDWVDEPDSFRKARERQSDRVDLCSSTEH